MEETVKEEVKLEFDPPLTYYTDGLPLGYVWLPPSSPVPMPMEVDLQGSMSCPGFGKGIRIGAEAFNTPLKRKRDLAPETPRKQKKTVTFTPETRG
jgi:hypothetical protein